MRYADVELRILPGDALIHHSDILALKYAQASYGVDRAAVHAAQVNAADLPGVEEVLLVEKPAGIASKDLLFIGVKPLWYFGYEAIRHFSYRALSTAAELRPAAREISMTLHGPGYGLDEAEAFESEVAGVVEAIDAGQHPADLHTVSFVESDTHRAQRMQEYLHALIGDARPHHDKGLAPSSRRLDSVGYDSAARPHAFIAIPFAEAFEDYFHYGIAPPIRAAGLLCERMDQVSFIGDILTCMKERIGSAELVVADLSGANPNVYLEVGYAWGREVPCILLCNDEKGLAFDVRGHRCLFYSSIRNLEKKLAAELKSLYTRQATTNSGGPATGHRIVQPAPAHPEAPATTTHHGRGGIGRGEGSQATDERRQAMDEKR